MASKTALTISDRIQFDWDSQYQVAADRFASLCAQHRGGKLAGVSFQAAALGCDTTEIRDRYSEWYRSGQMKEAAN